MAFPNSSDTDCLLERMATAPARYAALLSNCSEEQLNARSDPEQWTAREILAHVRAGDDLLTGRIYHILVRDNPPFLEVNERRWDEVAGYADYPLDLLLDSYALRRKELILTLRRIGPADWKRTGEHAKRGRVTVYTVAKHISDHEEEHLEQLRHTLGDPG